MKRARTLSELYSFPGFRAGAQLKGVFGDPDLRVIALRRKKRPAPVQVAAGRAARCRTGERCGHETFRPAGFALRLNSSGCG